MGGEECTILVLRLMHKLAMSHMRKVLEKEKEHLGQKSRKRETTTLSTDADSRTKC
jgi:hypothetical protein